MLPIVLQSGFARVGLIGRGDALARRLALLEEAGVQPLRLNEEPSDAEFASLKILFVAGLDERASRDLAQRARQHSVLVNVEDVVALCDFHVPATVRRGDLLITVSTGGRAPGLSRVVRESLEDRFGPEWSERVNRLSTLRGRLRADGLQPAKVSEKLRETVNAEGWLA
jgi:precorrin-2 dehydrogenase/sirohydrochlorin ferrochelatase